MKNMPKDSSGSNLPKTVNRAADRPVVMTPGQATKNVIAFGRTHRNWHRALNVHQKWR